jgi:hypothetical protein
MTERTRELADAISASSSSPPKNGISVTLQRRMALSKAITLIESKSPLQMRQADLLMNHLAKKKRTSNSESHINSESHSDCEILHGQESFRIGISGPPGAGKVLNKKQKNFHVPGTVLYSFVFPLELKRSLTFFSYLPYIYIYLT